MGVADKLSADLQTSQARSQSAASDADAQIESDRKKVHDEADAVLHQAQQDKIQSELAAQDAIATAQKAASDMKTQADTESASILAEAEKQANKVRQEAREDAAKFKEESRLKAIDAKAETQEILENSRNALQ